MRIVEENAEEWKQGTTIDEIWNHVARCARVCYQTQAKENENGKEFINRVILRGNSYSLIAKNPILKTKLHLSVLEHGTIYLIIVPDDVNYLEISTFYAHNIFSKVLYTIDVCFITTNLRVLIENGRMSDLKYISNPRHYHAKRTTICIISPIGGIRDTNRHRAHSISEESTRYCKYSSPKFGEGLTFVNLPWIDRNNIDMHIPNELYVHEDEAISEHITKWWDDLDWYFYCLEVIEVTYKKLISLGWTAQQASNVLPFATKTQSIHTAFDCDWEHYIALRSDEVSGPVRPEVKIIADKIKEIINNK